MYVYQNTEVNVCTYTSLPTVRIHKIPQHRLVNLRMYFAHISKARVYCSVLKCVSVPVLRCVAVCCSVCVLQCNACASAECLSNLASIWDHTHIACCSMLDVCCSVSIAVCRNVLQCVALYCCATRAPQRSPYPIWHPLETIDRDYRGKAVSSSLLSIFENDARTARCLSVTPPLC